MSDTNVDRIHDHHQRVAARLNDYLVTFQVRRATDAEIRAKTTGDDRWVLPFCPECAAGGVDPFVERNPADHDLCKECGTELVMVLQVIPPTGYYVGDERDRRLMDALWHCRRRLLDVDAIDPEEPYGLADLNEELDKRKVSLR